jgi:hypothetical protein
MLYDFRDRLILEYKNWWFVWEEAWDSFRPIDQIAWDGARFVLKDQSYCADPSDPLYGYGSQTMKEFCELLGRNRLEELPLEVNTLESVAPEWFFDRRVTLTTCAPRDYASWKRMVGTAYRTCRKAPKGQKCTRRISRTQKLREV